MAHFAVDGSDDVRFDPCEQGRSRSTDSQGISERISGCLSSRWHGQKRSARFSALRGFRNFPPMLVQIGSNETLLDDATRLAAQAGAADVTVTLEIWPNMIHAWPLWNAHLEDGLRALASAGSFIRAQP